MISRNKFALIFIILCTAIISLQSQDPDFTSFTIATDQDVFGPANEDRNYTMGLGFTLSGRNVLDSNLVLPFIRRRTVDQLQNWIFDQFEVDTGNLVLRYERDSINSFGFFGSAFTPEQLCDTVPEFQEKLNDGYLLENDRPFSFILGFTSSRDYFYYRPTRPSSHRASFIFGGEDWNRNIKLTSSFTLGIYGLNWARDIQSHIHENNWLGSTRPVPCLWNANDQVTYPTGQIKKKFTPAILFSSKIEKPILDWRISNDDNNFLKTIISIENELNVGYNTNASLGASFAFGSFRSSFTGANAIWQSHWNQEGVGSTQLGSWKVVVGINVRAVGYNGHLTNLVDWFATDHGNSINASNIERIIIETYLGFQISLRDISFTIAPISKRSAEIKGPEARSHSWGTAILTLNL